MHGEGMDFMMNENDKIEGLKAILYRIRDNQEGQLSHKDIRNYTRAILLILDNLAINSKIYQEVLLLFTMLDAYGLNHYTRSFLATRILELLSKNAYLTQQSSNNENF